MTDINGSLIPVVQAVREFTEREFGVSCGLKAAKALVDHLRESIWEGKLLRLVEEARGVVPREAVARVLREAAQREG
jgi:hypothetical protein